MEGVDLRYFPPLTKDYILNHVSQEEIFERYLGIRVDTSVPHKNPLREDNNPDCWFYYKRDNTGREVLRFNDFAGYFHGDCFDIVAFTINVNAKTKEGFKASLEHIAQTFGLHKYSNEEYLIKKYFDSVAKHKNKTTRKIDIQYIPRDWHKVDAQYWTAHQLDINYLNYYRVVPIQELYVNSNHIYTFAVNDPAYCYDFSRTDRRIYFPLRKKGVRNLPRFLSNTSIIQNIDKFTPSKFGIITKSYKDVMVLKKVCNNYFDIDSVAPSGETNRISPNNYFKLRWGFDYLTMLYDFDLTGVKYTRITNQKYPMTPFFITNGRFGTVDYKAKDVAEFVMRYGLDKTRFAVEKLIKEYEKYINQIENEQFGYNPRTQYNSMWFWK